MNPKHFTLNSEDIKSMIEDLLNDNISKLF